MITVDLKEAKRLGNTWYTVRLPRWRSGKRICLPVQETQEIQVPSLDWEDPLEKEVATHSSILA